MSTLKHNIRQQQAQLNNLETIVRNVPRSYSSSTDLSLQDMDYSYNYSNMASTSSSGSAPPSSYAPVGSANGTGPTPVNVKRRSSHDVLLSIAGPDSGLPLPKRDSILAEENGIREGIPTSPPSYKRASSPTRTLSRIPISAVGNARALTDEGATSRPPALSTSTGDTSSLFEGPSSASLQPPSPTPNYKRYSTTPAGTTKVLADLQTGVVNARNALENTKAQLRLSQRSVATLTRQLEDLKEGRDRLRLENEGLNNVVARKERLLQEVLERARKAEAEATTLKAQLKSETSTSKKTIRDMESALAESTALSSKSEREYITLRDSLKSMTESWKSDTERLRDEMRKREEKVRAEAEKVKKLREEDTKKGAEVEKMWAAEIEKMKERVENEGKQSDEAARIAKHLSEELARLRRLMQSAGRTSPTGDDASSSSNAPKKVDPPP
ncbi:hypothetical protein NLJ89_g4000 [Agrocybe chaxingu]|uniref:Uncharacterized protein n=1 Tax=Agrocybe chaxingu TaxID=84603 RepID=A0A9W8MY11_9AGAR|nr:hypothetical protein NLJ89_g4000 [Agrocybe chaxingu]